MNLAEQIFERQASSVKPEWLADLYGRLVWLLDDNGAEVIDTLRKWIEVGNESRAKVALKFDEGFLFQSRAEMVEAFDQLCCRFPNLQTDCDLVIMAWDKQGVE